MSETEGIAYVDLASQLTGAAELRGLREAIRAGPLEFRARGVSMRPLLNPGDYVRLEARRPRRGDVALAVRESRLVLHRVVRRRGDHCLLRGDAREQADGWVQAPLVLGVVTAKRRIGVATPRGAWRRIDRLHERWLGLAWVRIAAALRSLSRPFAADE